MTLAEYLKSIADAIRARKGTTAPINAQNFADEIENIPALDESNFLRVLITRSTSGLSETVVLDETVNRAGSYIFYNTKLNPKFTAELTYIDPYAFYGCGVGNGFDISTPQNTAIGSNSFQNAKVNNFYLNGVKTLKATGSIASLAFASCKNFYVNATIDEYLAGTWSFKQPGLQNVQNFYFKNEDGNYEQLPGHIITPTGITVIRDSAFSCIPNLKEVTVSEGVTTLEQQAFNQCTSTFTKIHLPSTLTTLGASCLGESYFTELVFPASVTSITNPVYKPKVKTTVIMMGETPPTGNLSTTTTNIKAIYVPASALNAYKTAWTNFSSLILPMCEVTFNVSNELLNNESFTYSIDQGATWNQFASTSIEVSNVATIHFKNGATDTTLKIGTTSGGAEIGSITDAQLIYNTSGDATIYLTVS